MKLLGLLFAMTGLLGTIIMIGAAGGCDMNTLTLAEATARACMGAVCVIISASGHKAVKTRLRHKYNY